MPIDRLIFRQISATQGILAICVFEKIKIFQDKIPPLLQPLPFLHTFPVKNSSIIHGVILLNNCFLIICVPIIPAYSLRFSLAS